MIPFGTAKWVFNGGCPFKQSSRQTASAAYKSIKTCNCLYINNKHTPTPALACDIVNCVSVQWLFCWKFPIFNKEELCSCLSQNNSDFQGVFTKTPSSYNLIS